MKKKTRGIGRGLSDLQDFLRDYTAGMSTREMRRVFERDAARAFADLTREQSRDKPPTDEFQRFWYRVRLVFLGLSYKLTPGRRMLFAGAWIAALLGSCDVRIGSIGKSEQLNIEFSPLWFLASIGTLTLLLALELADRLRVRDELEVAREVQRDLLPLDMPVIEGYRFASSYRTALEVGGDAYDVVSLPDGRVALWISDASGHGMAAGLVMAIAKATLSTALDLDPRPPRVAELLNRAIWRTGNQRTFLSAFYGLLTPETGDLQWVCAGHPFPLLLRRGADTGGEVQEIGHGGLPFGLREHLEAPCGQTTIERGETLVLYTDGLPEGVDPNSAAFGYERVASLVAGGGTPEQLTARILAAFDAHQGDEPLKDDLTILVVGRTAESQGSQSIVG